MIGISLFGYEFWDISLAGSYAHTLHSVHQVGVKPFNKTVRRISQFIISAK